MDELKSTVLITGANGFLGQKLIEQLVKDPNIHVVATSKRENRNFIREGYTYIPCDFEDNKAFKNMLEKIRPDRIIHTAAISSVEACESNPEQCQKVNIDTVSVLGNYCREFDKHLVHLSTDFVFDGTEGPYQETDKPNPCNAYGQSKLDSEQCLEAIGCRNAILRTILVYGINGDVNRSNLVLWAKGQLEQKQPIKVVADQWRMPTFVDDLAIATIQAMKNEAKGIYHISGEEMMTVLEAVQHVADFWNLDRSLISPITAKEIGQDKNRPQTTGFVLGRAKKELGFSPTPFKESLQKIEEQFGFYNR
ncbi:SDR family oxidoreductase [Sphingobacterium wenxiniae]|uniref:dTDP-4-dehydrorhamnose reductase n=1 Tax=Sphingobacterium wenxiniae TaxID=683125 RepID=A0A1I6VJ32_9SPHI|nr:SDR family oxidoreductase [Sphingobacterium wenxiniae]SFT13725.1 dTDP-4-dehydrorhamnose reductase [Sphingobacterium wenxiniae]